jgi:hypothetical protein
MLVNEIILAKDIKDKKLDLADPFLLQKDERITNKLELNKFKLKEL